MSNGGFSLKRDFKHIKWKETFWLNFLRSLFAGLVWTILMLLSGKPFSEAGMFFLMLPLCYFVVGLPLGLIGGFLSSLGVPFAGIFTTIFSIMVVVGDPLVFILHKIIPSIVPVEKFNFINFILIIFVLDNPKTEMDPTNQAA